MLKTIITAAAFAVGLSLAFASSAKAGCGDPLSCMMIGLGQGLGRSMQQHHAPPPGYYYAPPPRRIIIVPHGYAPPRRSAPTYSVNYGYRR